MNANNAISYQKSLNLFLKNQNSLPENIRWKLNHISLMVDAKPTENTQNLPQEYQLEIQDLKDVNQKGLKIIFTSIVQTLFNEQIPIDKQCLIKKKGFFKSWTDGFIKYDDTFIYFNMSNKTSRYRFKNVDVRLNSSSKRAFDFIYKGHFLMTIKFQKSESMHVMYKTVKSQIYKQKNKYDQQVIEKLSNVSQGKIQKSNENQKAKTQNQNTPNNNTDNQNTQSQNGHKTANHNGQGPTVQNKNLRQYQKTDDQQNMMKNHYKNQSRLKVAMQFQKAKISEQQNMLIIRNSKVKGSLATQLKLNPCPQNFQIKQSSKKMYIALSNEQIKLNLQIIVNLCGDMGINEIFSCLCLYRNWNSKVTKEQVCFQMKFQQKAIIYRVYQKTNSLLSKQRQTYSMLQYKKIGPQSGILVEESLQNEDRQQEHIRAYIKSIFFIQVYESNAKISIQAEFDPKGYCSNNEGQELLMSIYRDIVHFQNYLSEYIIKNDKNSQKLLFSEIQLQQQQKKEPGSENIFRKSSKSMQELEDQKSSDQDQRKNTKTSLQIYRRSSKRQPFLELRLDTPSRVPTIEYLELIRKKQYERYYLKHKFVFQVLEKYDSYLPWYCLQELLKKGGQYQITQKLQLHFINQKLIQSQKDILRFVIRQIGANLISGKSVLNISLPVDIFEYRTLLERSAASLGKCPDYLTRICEAQPLEQIMNVAAFIATVPTLQLVMQKPFNPILGQTFQCYLKGIPLCYEQISHHPPISSYYMECEQFKLYGNLIAFADVGLNSGVGGNLGVMHIVFKNGHHYQCHFPPSQISGLIYGDRKFRSYGRGYIIQKQEGLFAEFSIQKTKKGIYESKDKMLPGSIIGGIFKVNKKFCQYLKSFNNNLKKFPGISKQHISQKLVDISGIWFDKIYMNQKIITEGIRSYPVQYYPCSLPSDANFRLDVLYHKQNNLPQSQKQKQILEVIQRQDKKLRQKYIKMKK